MIFYSLNEKSLGTPNRIVTPKAFLSLSHLQSSTMPSSSHFTTQHTILIWKGTVGNVWYMGCWNRTRLSVLPYREKSFGWIPPEIAAEEHSPVRSTISSSKHGLVLAHSHDTPDVKPRCITSHTKLRNQFQCNSKTNNAPVRKCIFILLEYKIPLNLSFARQFFLSLLNTIQYKRE